MRKWIVVGLIAVALAIVGPPFIALNILPRQSPLRAGMSKEDVERIAGGPIAFDVDVIVPTSDTPSKHWALYFTEPDFFGSRSLVFVNLDEDFKVKSWEVNALPRTRPPWLHTALKWVGW